MLSWVDHAHHGVVCKHRGNGVGAAADGLAQNEQVGLHVRRLSFAPRFAGAVAAGGEQRTGACNARLDFVGHEQDVRGLAQRVGLAHVIVGGDVHAGLTLDGFDQEASDVGVLEGGGQGIEVVVGNDLKPWSVGPKPSCAVRIRRERHDGRRAAVEVLGTRDDFGGAGWHALHVVRPLARNFDGGLDRFCAGVHGQDLVVPKVRRHILLIWAQNAVVEGT